MRPETRPVTWRGLPSSPGRPRVGGPAGSKACRARVRGARIVVLVAVVLLPPVLTGCGGSGGTPSTPAPPASDWGQMKWNQSSWR